MANDPVTQQRFSGSSELEQATAASATGDVHALHLIFKKWSSPQLQPEALCPALSAAVTNNQAATAAYLLDHGVPMNQELFLHATVSKSYSILQAFLDRGWDINTPVDLL